MKAAFTTDVLKAHLSGSRRARGFTLIELMIVMFIIVTLVSIAAPAYSRAVVGAKETVLRQDLYHMRQAIDEYTMDKFKAPQTLDDLVTGGYLKSLPKDPFTNKTDTWQPVMEDTLLAIDQTEPGITDVHSGATGNGLDGTPYNSW
jgi:general secretion pathway protein G